MTIYTEFKLKFMHIISEKTIYQVILLRTKDPLVSITLHVVSVLLIPASLQVYL